MSWNTTPGLYVRFGKTNMLCIASCWPHSEDRDMTPAACPGLGQDCSSIACFALHLYTIWLWHSQFAMERSTIFKNGKPSISIRAIYTMAM